MNTLFGHFGLWNFPPTFSMQARYHAVLGPRLRERYQTLAEEIGEPHWRTHGWVLIGFDGSRATAPRTVSNERAFCAANYGHGKRAKSGKKNSQGLRRQRNLKNKPQPPAPQAGITRMWLLTSVLDRRKRTKKQIIRFDKMRWGLEVEFRGLKQTIDQHTLRCRNSDRLLVELDWSIRAMAVAELLALREQLSAKAGASEAATDPIDRNLAKTMRALRTCLRHLDKHPRAEDSLRQQLSPALVQRYEHHTDKRSRYRPKNPDQKPLGDPEVKKMTTEEREKLREFRQSQAA